VDTNVLLSGAVWPFSLPGRAVLLALASADILISLDILREYEDVFQRDKFDRYMPLEMRLAFLARLLSAMNPIEIDTHVQICDDPRDDKFLSLAVSGEAEIIITGDDHLLRLHPFRGIDILKPIDYLSR
jgi:putative PIN family toxin of toxin-antitoxin system